MRQRVAYKNDNSVFLTFSVYPFVIFGSDYALISCLLCKLNTLWNIFMIFGRNVQQDKSKCHIQE